MSLFSVSIRALLLLAGIVFVASLPRAAAPALRHNGPVSIPSPLDGQKLLIRCYEPKRTDPATYEMQELTIKDGGKVELPRGHDSIMLAIAADQSKAIAAGFEKAIYILYGQPAWDVPQGHPEAGFHPLADALGDSFPLSGLTLNLLIGDDRIPLEPALFTSQGVATLPLAEGPTFHGYAVAHPSYGGAYLEPSVLNFNAQIRVPLVLADSPAAARAITGTVTAPGGTPIEHASIKCQDVHTPGGGLISGYGFGAESGPDGKFLFYMPPSNNQHEYNGGLIPSDSRYHLVVSFPAAFHSLPLDDEFPNTQPAQITLPHTDGPHSFTFQLTPEHALLGDELQRVRIFFMAAPQARRVDVPAPFLAQGGLVPNGTYQAEYLGERGEQRAFAPLQVTAASPEHLTFTIPVGKHFTGRAINGADGQPIPGALVFSLTSIGGGRLADLTPQDWQALRSVTDQTSLTAQLLDPLRKVYYFDAITRTAPDGTFDLAPPPGSAVGSVVLCDEKYTGFIVRTRERETSSTLPVTPLGDIKLYPSARIHLQVHVPAEALGSRALDPKHAHDVYNGPPPSVNISVMPRWLIDDHDNPAWAAEIESYASWHKQNQGQFAYDGWLPHDQSIDIEIPANVHLQLLLRVPYGEDVGSFLVPRALYAQPGQTLDLGGQTLPLNVQIAVRVVDEQAQPQEGVPVRALDKLNNTWSIGHNTDNQGLAYFFIPPARPTKVGILLHSPNPKQRQRLTVDAIGSTTTSVVPVFTIQLDAPTAATIRSGKIGS